MMPERKALDHPVAHPTGSKFPELQPPQNALNGPLREPTMPPLPKPSPAPTKPNNRAGSHNRSTLMKILSERDSLILQLVRQHKFLTTRQLQRLLFHAHTTIDAGTRACTRVLQRLRQQRFLYRIERPIGGIRGGSGAYIWGLDVAGDRATRDSAPGPDDKRLRAFEPTSPFLTHTLAIAETRVLLEEGARAGRFELDSVATEPANWRTHTGRGGEPLILKPDLYVVSATGEFEDHWFIEIDQGTESLPTLIRKCRAYVAYRDSGHEQAHTGVFPLVLWILSEPTRRHRLAQLIAREPHLDARLFEVEAPENLVARFHATPTNQSLPGKEEL